MSIAICLFVAAAILRLAACRLHAIAEEFRR